MTKYCEYVRKSRAEKKQSTRKRQDMWKIREGKCQPVVSIPLFVRLRARPESEDLAHVGRKVAPPRQTH